MDKNEVKWYPANLDGQADGSTWEYTYRDKHFWPPDGLVKPDASLIIDVGANAGFSTGLFAVAWPNAKIIGIEMNPATADRARANLTEFGDRVKILTEAVGFPERDELAIFTTSSAIDHLSNYEYSEGDSVTVRIKTLDDILESEGITGKIDFIKMDIEGAEWEILCGGGKWASQTSVITIEAHSWHRPGEDFTKALENLGFSITYNHHGQLTGYH